MTVSCRKALEAWQPQFIDWWMEMGPAGYQQDDIYLRTAVSVESGGWANYDYVKMPDYRWGIFRSKLSWRPSVLGTTSARMSGSSVPVNTSQGPFAVSLLPRRTRSRHRSSNSEPWLKWHPASTTCGTFFQVNVEEGRHLWAMAYLLHRYLAATAAMRPRSFLIRRSVTKTRPVSLGAFNQPIENFLDFFCFAMFADRDGKYQLASLAESCRFGTFNAVHVDRRSPSPLCR